MTEILVLLKIYLPWILILGLIIVFYKLTRWAQRRKTGVVIFMALIQMIMPDPFAERTIETVQMEKKKIVAADEEGEPV